jgi:Kef-type K+ transport system membrane component KefB
MVESGADRSRRLRSGRRAARRLFLLCVLAGVLIAGRVALASEPAHTDPIARLVLWLAIILVAAKLGGHLAVRFGQPAVLGELGVGIVLGNLDLVGFRGLEPISQSASVEMLAHLGVLLLLFQVGLESTVAQMLRVGLSALLVATLGVVAPFALGWAVGAWLLPQAGPYVHAFLGATLAATSVGITARVLQDLGRARTAEARVILGAAVIDDVLGLAILAAVTTVIAGVDRGTSVSWTDILLTLLKTSLFLVAAIALGVLVSRRLFSLASQLRADGTLLAVGLSFCFVMSWFASAIGLAAIIGAFAAGLILEEAHYRDFVDRGEHGLEELIRPVSSFLVPVFFVFMGMGTELRVFARPEILGLAGALTVAAVLGKQACGLGVIGRQIDRLAVGLGMVPRGEVGLIFANIGLTLSVKAERVIDAATFSAIVVMIVVTTVITPPLLRWRFARLPPAR